MNLPNLNIHTNSGRTNSANGPQQTSTYAEKRKGMQTFLDSYLKNGGIITESSIRTALKEAGATNIQVTINKSTDNNGNEIFDVHVTFTWKGEDFDQNGHQVYEKGPGINLTGSRSGTQNSDGDPKSCSNQVFKDLESQAVSVGEKINAYKYLLH